MFPHLMPVASIYDQFYYFFQAFLIVFIKPTHSKAIQVKNSKNLVSMYQRAHDFAFGFSVASYMSRIAVNVRHWFRFCIHKSVCTDTASFTRCDIDELASGFSTKRSKQKTVALNLPIGRLGKAGRVDIKSWFYVVWCKSMEKSSWLTTPVDCLIRIWSEVGWKCE